MFLMGISLIRQIRGNSENQESLLGFAFLLYVIVAGSVTITPAYYARELFFVFIFVWITAGSNLQVGDDQYAHAT